MIRYTYICPVLTKKHKLKIMKKNLRNVLVLGLGLITTTRRASVECRFKNKNR